MCVCVCSHVRSQDICSLDIFMIACTERKYSARKAHTHAHKREKKWLTFLYDDMYVGWVRVHTHSPYARTPTYVAEAARTPIHTCFKHTRTLRCHQLRKWGGHTHTLRDTHTYTHTDTHTLRTHRNTETASTAKVRAHIPSHMHSYTQAHTPKGTLNTLIAGVSSPKTPTSRPTPKLQDPASPLPHLDSTHCHVTCCSARPVRHCADL